MAEWSRRGLAAGVVGAGCTLRLDPALYGVTGIAKSRSGRQLRPRGSSPRLSAARGARKQQAETLQSQLQRWRVKLGGHRLLFTGYTAVFLPEMTDLDLAEKPVTNSVTASEFDGAQAWPARTARGA